MWWVFDVRGCMSLLICCNRLYPLRLLLPYTFYWTVLINLICWPIQTKVSKVNITIKTKYKIKFLRSNTAAKTVSIFLLGYPLYKNWGEPTLRWKWPAIMPNVSAAIWWEGILQNKRIKTFHAPRNIIVSFRLVHKGQDHTIM